MSRRLRNQRGSMLTGLTLQAGIVLLMILTAIPVVRHTRRENHARACTDNLAVLLAAKEKFIVNHDLRPGAKVSLTDLTSGTTPLLKIIPVCPDRGDYVLGPAGELPTCSIPGHTLPMAGRSRKHDPALDVTTSTRVQD